jgi:hypothetical protein
MNDVILSVIMHQVDSGVNFYSIFIATVRKATRHCKTIAIN